MFFGASLALVLATFLAVVFANFVCNYIPTDLIKKVAAVGFVVTGVLTFFDKL